MFPFNSLEDKIRGGQMAFSFPSVENLGQPTYTPDFEFAKFGLIGTWDAVGPDTVFSDAGGTAAAQPGSGVARHNMRRSAGGGHYTQVTAAARPVFTRLPTTGGFSVLEYEANWSRWQNSPANANTLTPEGSSLRVSKSPSVTGSLVSASHIGQVNTTYTAVLDVEPSGYNWCYLQLSDTSYSATFRVFFNISTGEIGSVVNSPVDFGIIRRPDGPGFRLWVSATSDADGGNYVVGFGTASLDNQVSFLGDGVSGMVVHAADVQARPGPFTPQRRFSANNITEPGVPDAYYLQGDGVDDFMVSAARLDLSGFDGATMIWAGEKLTDAAIQIVSSHGEVSNGEIALGSAMTASWDGLTREANNGVRSTVSGVAFPDRTVLTVTVDRASNVTRLRRNGTAAPANTTPVTGNMLDSVVSLLARNSAGLTPAAARHSGLFICGGVLPSASLHRVEQYFAKRIGVTL